MMQDVLKIWKWTENDKIDQKKNELYIEIFGRNGDIENCKLGKIFGQVSQDEKEKKSRFRGFAKRAKNCLQHCAKLNKEEVFD